MRPDEYILDIKNRFGEQSTKDGQLIRDMNDQELMQRMFKRYPGDKDKVVGYEEYLTPEETPPSLPKSQTRTALDQLVGGVTEVFKNRVNNIKDEKGKMEAGEQGYGRTLLHTAGEIAGGIGDVGFEAIKSVVKPEIKEKVSQGIDYLATTDNPLVSAAIDNPVVTGARQTKDKLTEENPELAKDLEAGVNIASIVPGVGAGVKGTKKAVDVIETVTEAATQANKVASKPLIEATKATAQGVTSGASTGFGTVWEGVKKMGRNLKNYAEDTAETAQVRKALKAEKGDNAIRVVDETGSPEFVNLVDNTKSKTDLATKRKMLDVAGERINGTASKKLPRQVVAEEFVAPRIKVLEDRLDEVGKKIGAAKTDKRVVDTTDVFKTMVVEARKQGVVVNVNKNGSLSFSKIPGVSGIDQARINTMKGIFDGFSVNPKTGKTSNSISQLAATRKNLSDLTKRTDAAKEVVSPGGPVDNVRRLIAEKIGPEYFQATKEYSDIIRTLKKLDPDLDVRLSEDAVNELSNIKIGDYARRLLSNNATQAKSVFKSLDELYKKEAARRGIEPSDGDIEDLMDFAGAIEEGFDITPRNSFFGQVKGATQGSDIAASMAVDAATGMPIATAVNTVKNLATKPQVSKKRALEAMKAYLDEAIAKQN